VLSEKTVEQRPEKEESSFDDNWWAVGLNELSRNRVILLITGLVNGWRWC
jgi:hypothetical protein